MNILKHWRKKHKLTQSQLAVKLSKNRYTITSYETGYCPIPIAIALQLGELFECSPALFAGRNLKNDDEDEVVSPVSRTTRLIQLQTMFINMRFKLKDN